MHQYALSLHLLDFSSCWRALLDLDSPGGNPSAALKSTSKWEEQFYWRVSDHRHACCWLMGLVLPRSRYDQCDRVADLLTASSYFRKIIFLCFHTPDFFFAFLFKFSAPQRGLYSIYCNRITIFSEASEHRGNINNKKAFIKAYKGNFVLWFKACKMSLGKYSSKGVED